MHSYLETKETQKLDQTMLHIRSGIIFAEPGVLTVDLLPLQVTTYLPFEIYLTFKTSGALTINDYRFTSELMSKIEEFDERFEDTFQLKAKVGVVIGSKGYLLVEHDNRKQHSFITIVECDTRKCYKFIAK